jgi:hypothetical protein
MVMVLVVVSRVSLRVCFGVGGGMVGGCSFRGMGMMGRMGVMGNYAGQILRGETLRAAAMAVAVV